MDAMANSLKHYPIVMMMTVVDVMTTATIMMDYVEDNIMNSIIHHLLLVNGN